MKKLVLSSIFAFLLTFASVANASTVTDQIQAAINAGNYDQIGTIAAANAGAQGEIAMFLLDQALAKISSNPSQAAQIFAAAGPYVSQIPAGESGSAATKINSIVSAASGAGFQSSNPGAASDIFTAALLMTNQPNILAANPNLHAGVLSAANTFVQNNPQGANDGLKNAVQLAETAGSAPGTGPVGAHIPTTE